MKTDTEASKFSILGQKQISSGPHGLKYGCETYGRLWRKEESAFIGKELVNRVEGISSGGYPLKSHSHDTTKTRGENAELRLETY